MISDPLDIESLFGIFLPEKIRVYLGGPRKMRGINDWK